MSLEALNQEAIDRDIESLLQTVHSVYGYDFRNYAKASQKRRILSFLESARIDTVDSATQLLAEDSTLFFRFLDHLMVPTTDLFRDPEFFREFSRSVVPVLRSYATFKVWHAGCSTGEEVYSVLMLLHEHDLLQRAVVYATDVDRAAVQQARKGIVSARVLKRGAQNYLAAGLQGAMHEYWHVKHGFALLASELLRKAVFSEHNLVTDAVFGEMQVILCRNVLIYFDRELQDRVLRKLVSSLARGGFLCLGNQESATFSSVASELDAQNPAARIYKRKFRL